MTAPDILAQAAAEMADRARTYDKPAGERSMAATVAAFAVIAGVRMSETQGWLFMALLKAVRSQQGAHRADNYVDGAAYFALAGEAAAVAAGMNRGERDGGCDAAWLRSAGDTAPSQESRVNPWAAPWSEGEK